MKLATKKKKKLETAKEWLEETREYYRQNDSPGLPGYFYLLIAVEQLIEYLEMG